MLQIRLNSHFITPKGLHSGRMSYMLMLNLYIPMESVRKAYPEAILPRGFLLA